MATLNMNKETTAMQVIPFLPTIPIAACSSPVLGQTRASEQHCYLNLLSAVMERPVDELPASLGLEQDPPIPEPELRRAS